VLILELSAWKGQTYLGARNLDERHCIPASIKIRERIFMNKREAYFRQVIIRMSFCFAT